jgi:hypothetical protein
MTLVELAITLAITGALSLFMGTGLQAMADRISLNAAVAEVVGDLRYARSMAVREGEPIKVAVGAEQPVGAVTEDVEAGREAQRGGQAVGEFVEQRSQVLLQLVALTQVEQLEGHQEGVGHLRHVAAERCRRRHLLEADRETLKLLRHDPFDGKRPRFVRAILYRYRFSTPAERRASGAWWVRTPVGEYVQPLSLHQLR